jgi:hypothetical protein
MIGIAKNYAATAPFVAYNAFATPLRVDVMGDSGGLTSNLLTINAVGGTAPYTYAWIKLSGDDISISSTTSEIVSFSASGSNGEKSAIYRCTVTDVPLAVSIVDVNILFLFGEQS